MNGCSPRWVLVLGSTFWKRFNLNSCLISTGAIFCLTCSSAWSWALVMRTPTAAGFWVCTFCYLQKCVRFSFELLSTYIVFPDCIFLLQVCLSLSLEMMVDNSSNWCLRSVWFSKSGIVSIWNNLGLVTGVSNLEWSIMVLSESSVCLYSIHKVETSVTRQLWFD